MNISVISYAFNVMMKEGKIDLFGYLEACKYRYGLSNADIWNGMLLSTDADYLAKVKDGLQERELALANLAVDGAHIWEDEAEKRELHYQRALAHLKAGEVLGAKTVRIDAGSRAASWTNEQFDLIVKRYKEYARRAYDGGYKVGPENHWGPEMVPGYLKQLCEAVDSPAFGILLHFRRWVAGEDLDAADRLLAPWAMHTHLTKTISDCLEEKMILLHDMGYKGCWSVEYVGSYAEIGVQLARVRDILDKWRVAK
jgi:sugar phosphate isomerase/epimerase